MERLEVEILARIAGFERSLELAQSKLQKFGEAAKDMGETLTKVLTLPIAGLAAAAIKSFGSIQSLKNGLAAVTGSADEAAKQFVRLQKLAQLPGLGLAEVSKGAINLQVIGFSAAKAEKSMAAFGNAVATVGKGRVEFERAIYGLSQLANTDFPLGEDLNILKDAIPQVTPLLKEAFGTARSDELTKLGITSAQVVDTIVNGLSKLPPVTGGINGAFENLSDGVTSNLADIGQSIDEAFNIAGIINTFLDGLTSVTSMFTSLSPEAKKVIFVIAGIAAAIGPLLLVLGVLSTTVIPALITGFGLLSSAITIATGPIGLIVAAVAAAVYLIIKNWDTIVSYFTNGPGAGVFTGLKDLFFDAIEVIQAAWGLFVGVLTDFWREWGSTILAVGKYFMEALTKYLQVIFTFIGGVFQAFTAVLKGNWADAGSILLNMTKRVWNGILNIITDVIKAGGGLVAKFFEFIGLEGVADKFESINTTIANLVGKTFSFDIPVTVDLKAKDPKLLKLVSGALDGGLDKPDAPGAPKAPGGGKAVKVKAPVLEMLEPSGESQRNFAKYMQMLGSNTALKVDVPKLTVTLPPPFKLELGELVDVQQAALDEKIAKMNESLSEAANTILSSGVQDAFAAVGTSIGESLANGSSLISSLGTGLLSVVGNMAIQLGKLAIGVGVTLKGIKLAFQSMNPVVAVAAGVALIALGSFISSKVASIGQSNGNSPTANTGPIRAFAQGGIISGPTVGLMGEYSGARSNPEVVAPLNKLKGMLGDTKSDVQVFIPEARIGNDAIYIAYKKGEKSQDRL